MKHGALVALFVAAAFAVATAQVPKNFYPNFPYCGCQRQPSPYSVSPTIKSFNNGTYCFTIKVNLIPGCNSYCCTKADLKKMEFNVAKTCDVFAAQVSATVNGKPTKVGPAFDGAKEGPADATILRLTQLGLNLANANNAEICVTLASSKPGKGCTTLEQLCSTFVGGSTPDACSIALFDNQNDCCPISTPATYSAPPPPPPSPPPPPPPSPPPPPPPSPPPPPPPSPPPPPPPSPPPPPPPSPPPPPPPSPPPPSPSPPPPKAKPCKICAYLVLEAVSPIFPVSILDDQCKAWAEAVSSDVYNQALSQGIAMVDAPPEVTCSNSTVKVCGTFVDEDAAKALQPWLDTQILFWLQLVTGGDSCPAYLDGYKVSVTVGGDGMPPAVPNTCINGFAAQECKPADVDFPKCICNTKPLSTPFAAYPVTYKIPSDRNYKASLYCFTLAVVEPSNPDSPCGKTDLLLKAEIYASDKLRRKVSGVAVQANGASKFTFLASTWGAIGENTLKATPLNWSKRQADSARICIELDNSVALKDLCMTNSDTCWINFFDATKNCCPLYSATLI